MRAEEVDPNAIPIGEDGLEARLVYGGVRVPIARLSNSQIDEMF